MLGDNKMWPATTELHERLVAIEAVIDRFIGVNEAEHLLVDLLKLLNSGRITRAEGVAALSQLATQWPVGADEALEFCLRDLQWRELHDVLTRQASEAADFRIRDRAKRVLEVYEENWPAGDIYRAYRAPD